VNRTAKFKLQCEIIEDRNVYYYDLFSKNGRKILASKCYYDKITMLNDIEYLKMNAEEANIILV